MRRLLWAASMLIIGLLLCGSAYAKGPKETKNGTLSGQITIKDSGPVKNGMVFFFNDASGPPPSDTEYWRVPTDAFRADENGRFRAILPEGTYYMGAIEKLSGEPLGPPQERENFFVSRDKKGKPVKYIVKKNSVTDIGIISGSKPFSRDTISTSGITAIEGSIRDDKGKPVSGMLVFAFSTPTLIGRPMFVSERSDKDGKYLLRLHSGGKYYLKARANYGGGPRSTDELMGIYHDGKPVTVKTSAVTEGIDITVSRVGAAPTGK